METKKMTLWGRALRATLVLVLACGLVPSQALTSNAYAAGNDQSSEAAPAIHSEDVALSDAASADMDSMSSSTDAMASGADASEDAAATSSDAMDASAQSGTSADPAVQDIATDMPISSGAASAGQDDILRVQVDLTQGDTASTAIAFGGLAFMLNDDGENTVTLTGWTGTAPKGALAVPAEVTIGANTYKVSKIGLAGGGSRLRVI